jgi:hypothetical protein
LRAARSCGDARQRARAGPRSHDGGPPVRKGHPQIPQITQTPVRRPPIVNPKSKIQNPLRLSKYLSVFVWTYAELYRDLRRHVRLHLNLDLNLNLNLWSHPALNPKLLTKPFKRSFKKPFSSSFRAL